MKPTTDNVALDHATAREGADGLEPKASDRLHSRLNRFVGPDAHPQKHARDYATVVKRQSTVGS